VQEHGVKAIRVSLIWQFLSSRFAGTVGAKRLQTAHLQSVPHTEEAVRGAVLPGKHLLFQSMFSQEAA
jgi:hypothetical protein